MQPAASVSTRAAGPEAAFPPGAAAERLLTGRAPATWNLPEQIAVRIGEQILNEELAPGARVREDAMAESFGVSRGPIRDALKILQSAGLVVITSRHGSLVAPLTERDLREILELREVLIATALRRFAEIASPDDLALLQPHLRVAETLIGDEAQMFFWLEAMDRLVLAIAFHAGNNRLAKELGVLSLQAIRYLRRGVRSVENRRELFAFHRDYVQAVERGVSVEPFIERLHHLVQKRIGTVSTGL